MLRKILFDILDFLSYSATLGMAIILLTSAQKN